MSLVAAGRIGRGARKVVLGVTLGAVLLSGCARFDDSASSPFTTEPSWQDAEPETKDPQSPSTSAQRPTGPCIDPDPAVVVSCLGITGGVVTTSEGALVAERTVPAIMRVTPTADPSQAPLTPEKVRDIQQEIDVSTADGGLMDLALSPYFNEDGLIYAYVTSPSDNRVIRISEDGSVKPILTGIPKGQTGNRGAIDFSGPEELLLLTGDAGNPAAAEDPNSLAGKLLRVDNPAPNSPRPTVLISGIGVAGDVCVSSDSVWVTDRTAVEDRLQRVAPDGAVTKAWSWPDHPGVAGCAAATDGVAIAMTEAKALAFAKVDPPTQTITEAPSLTVQGKYGRLNGASLGADGAVWVGTVNKEAAPGEFDDRIVRIPPPSAGNGSGPD
ncbi:PQQ-dependent sugar dehydrogenase [Nocardia crassostreae]|uniref:PQQ-dependent sugar dehydrogenase n=1 Tax=Nocardia crassostreae TaxID=53428 RepID=UPI00082A70FA|nr:PQQ-dependent sugar dehydrogenase [Nocardia crassostreae]